MWLNVDVICACRSVVFNYRGRGGVSLKVTSRSLLYKNFLLLILTIMQNSMVFNSR